MMNISFPRGAWERDEIEMEGKAVADEILSTTLAWAIQQVTEKSSSDDHVIAKLGLT